MDPGTAFLVCNRMQSLTAEILSRDTASRRKWSDDIGRTGKSVKLSPKTCKAEAIIQIKSLILLRGTVNSITKGTLMQIHTDTYIDE